MARQRASGNPVRHMYEGLDIEVERGVYEPAEDSFLLAKHARGLRGRILEVGCGTGIVSLANAKANPSNEVLGIDISPPAVRCGEKNARRNGIRNARFAESDLFGNVRGCWDAILFNAPYLAEEMAPGPVLERAWQGGRQGREPLDRFLEDAPKHLKSGGVLLFIQSELNGLEGTRQRLGPTWQTEILEEEPFFFDRIYAVWATKKY